MTAIPDGAARVQKYKRTDGDPLVGGDVPDAPRNASPHTGRAAKKSFAKPFSLLHFRAGYIIILYRSLMLREIGRKHTKITDYRRFYG